jgi:hypothetical protein
MRSRRKAEQILSTDDRRDGEEVEGRAGRKKVVAKR